MIPRKFGGVVFAFILSGLMSLFVSGISTVRALGWVADTLGLWTGAWLAAWVVAFPIVVIAAPPVRRFTDALSSVNAAQTAALALEKGNDPLALLRRLCDERLRVDPLAGLVATLSGASRSRPTGPRGDRVVAIWCNHEAGTPRAEILS